MRLGLNYDAQLTNWMEVFIAGCSISSVFSLQRSRCGCIHRRSAQYNIFFAQSLRFRLCPSSLARHEEWKMTQLVSVFSVLSIVDFWFFYLWKNETTNKMYAHYDWCFETLWVWFWWGCLVGLHRLHNALNGNAFEQMVDTLEMKTVEREQCHSNDRSPLLAIICGVLPILKCGNYIGGERGPNSFTFDLYWNMVH